MLNEIFSSVFFFDIISVLMVGMVIKIMDDLIDEEYPDYMLKAFVPYSLIIFIFAVMANYKLSISLFLSSYIIGMFTELNDEQLSGLRGYQESLIVFLMAAYVLGMEIMFFSLFIITSIHLFDDVIDFKADIKLNRNNLVIKYGKIEVFIFAVICLIFSFKINIFRTLIIIVLTPVITFIFKKIKGGMLECL